MAFHRSPALGLREGREEVYCFVYILLRYARRRRRSRCIGEGGDYLGGSGVWFPRGGRGGGVYGDVAVIGIMGSLEPMKNEYSSVLVGPVEGAHLRDRVEVVLGTLAAPAANEFHLSPLPHLHFCGEPIPRRHHVMGR